MDGVQPLAWLEEELAALDMQDLRRSLTQRGGPQGATLRVDGRELLNFGSNDYLGLAGDRRLVDAACRAAKTEGWGAGASPLVTGYAPSHRLLEERLAAFEGTEAAVVFTSGFAANVAAITSLAGRGDCIYSDAWNHASIVDGCRLSRAEVHVYPHCDTARLEALLSGSGRFRRRLIVTDSLFSMEGDLAPLANLASLAEHYDAMLMVDEAHATGVFGKHGRGVAEQLGVEDRVHVRVGTMSKALGGVGGFVAGSRLLVEWLINRSRTYIFSTAGLPAASAAALAALEILAAEPQRGRQLLARAEDLRQRFREHGWDTGHSNSQIIPLIAGGPATALRLADLLREHGIWAPAIRPPSVPAGRALLRISLSHAHTPDMLDRLVEALAAARHRHPV